MRRSNKNTLSGLSLESIAQQVKALIEQQEQRERKGGTRQGSVKPTAKMSSHKSHVVSEKKGKVRGRFVVAHYGYNKCDVVHRSPASLRWPWLRPPCRLWWIMTRILASSAMRR